MPGSGRNINHNATAFTPVSGTAVQLTEAQDVAISDRTEVRPGRGDNDYFPSSKNIVGSDPQIVVTLENVVAVLGLAPGTRGGFTTVLLDARNVAGAGAVTVTVATPLAIISDRQHSGAHQQIAKATLTIDTYSADGITPPIAYSVATS